MPFKRFFYITALHSPEGNISKTTRGIPCYPSFPWGSHPLIHICTFYTDSQHVKMHTILYDSKSRGVFLFSMLKKKHINQLFCRYPSLKPVGWFSITDLCPNVVKPVRCLDLHKRVQNNRASEATWLFIFRYNSLHDTFFNFHKGNKAGVFDLL